GQLGDAKETLGVRLVFEHELHKRAVLNGGDELSADRRSAELTCDRFYIPVNREPGVRECLLEFRGPLRVVDRAIGQAWVAFAGVLEDGGASAVGLRLSESLLVKRRVGFGEAVRC